MGISSKLWRIETFSLLLTPYSLRLTLSRKCAPVPPPANAGRRVARGGTSSAGSPPPSLRSAACFPTDPARDRPAPPRDRPGTPTPAGRVFQATTPRSTGRGLRRDPVQGWSNRTAPAAPGRPGSRMSWLRTTPTPDRVWPDPPDAPPGLSRHGVADQPAPE